MSQYYFPNERRKYGNHIVPNKSFSATVDNINRYDRSKLWASDYLYLSFLRRRAMWWFFSESSDKAWKDPMIWVCWIFQLLFIIFLALYTRI